MASTTASYKFPDLLEDPADPSTHPASSRPPRLIDLSTTYDKQSTDNSIATEDVSLSDLLRDDCSTLQSRGDNDALKGNGSRSDGTSETTGSVSVADDTVGMEEFCKYEEDEEDTVGMEEQFRKYEEDEGSEDEDYEDSNSEDSSESSVHSDSSDNTKNILEKAHTRLENQSLKEEIKALEATVEQRDNEIEQLSGQLRRAVSTKCDLVLSHSELERFHEATLKKRDADMVLVQQANHSLLEMRANIEKEFMNELGKVTEEMEEEKKKHREEMDDWERMHRNEMLEKEFTIAQLGEELRKAKAASGQSLKVEKKKPFAGMFKHTP
jgi:myosin heavy subunit